MRKDTTLLGAAAMVVCLAIYWNALDNGFHYDDIHSIVENPSIRSLGNIPSFFHDLSTFSADIERGMFRPLLLISYALNHAAAEYDVQGYRLVNILIHAVNACLVAWLTALLYSQHSGHLARRRAAIIAGLLFVVHPIATEPVNYISSRSESLASAFYLLALALYIRAREGQPERHPYGAWVAFELGLLTKMTVVTAPVAMFMYELARHAGRSDYARGRGFDNVSLLRRLVPFGALLLIHIGIVTANQFLRSSLGEPVRDMGTQLLTQAKAVGYYLYLAFLPAHLNIEHQFSVDRQISLILIVSLALIASLLWLLWLLYRRGRDRTTMLAMSWSILIMLPVMAMPLNVLVNERRLYLPVAMLCLMLGSLLARYCRPQPRFVIPVLVVLVLAVTCVQRNRVWADDFSLWGDAVHDAPSMPRGHLYLGNAHKDAALRAREVQAARYHWGEAASAYEKVIELGSDRGLSLRALNNLGSILLKFGELEDAEVLFRQATELDPGYVDARVNLGVIYLEQSRSRAGGERMRLLRRSVSSLEQAVALRPYHWQAFGNLGVAYQDLGDVTNARRAYERALTLKSDDAKALKNLSVLHMQLATRPGADAAREHLTRAQGYLQRAVRAAPGYRAAREVLSKVNAQLEHVVAP